MFSISEEHVRQRKIFFYLYARFPELLYKNYMENAKLLAEWLGADNWTRPFEDEYSINELTRITRLPATYIRSMLDVQHGYIEAVLGQAGVDSAAS